MWSSYLHEYDLDYINYCERCSIMTRLDNPSVLIISVFLWFDEDKKIERVCIIKKMRILRKKVFREIKSDEKW